MRKLNLTDVFKMARLVKECKLHNVITRGFEKGAVKKTKDSEESEEKEDQNAEQVGLAVFMDVVCSCCTESAEKQLYGLLAGVTEKTEKEVASQSLEATYNDIKKICEENNITNFIKSAFNAAKSMRG